MRVTKTYHIPDPPKVKCCYCGKEFSMSSSWKQLPDEYFEEFVDRLTIQMDMVDDGIPLECGECRPHPEKETDTFCSMSGSYRKEHDYAPDGRFGQKW